MVVHQSYLHILSNCDKYYGNRCCSRKTDNLCSQLLFNLCGFYSVYFQHTQYCFDEFNINNMVIFFIYNYILIYGGRLIKLPNKKD